VAWIAAIIVLSSGFRGRRRNMIAPLSSLAVSLIALLHSSIDFSLQMAGYSIVVFALLGIGLSQAIAWGKNGRSRESSDYFRSTQIKN
jgi:hypothetical protein